MGKILTGFEHVAAKPKGRDPEQEEAPAQESMRGGRTLLANPSTDEKKVKRRIRRNASAEPELVDADPIGEDLWSTALLVQTPPVAPVAKTAVELDEDDRKDNEQFAHRYNHWLTDPSGEERRDCPECGWVKPEDLEKHRTSSLGMATEARLLDEVENRRTVASSGDDLRHLAWSDVRYLKNFMQTLNGHGVLMNYTTDYGTTSAEGILHYDGETATVTNKSGTSISVPSYNVLRVEPSENPDYPAPHSSFGPDADGGGTEYNPISPLFHGLIPSGAMGSLVEADNGTRESPLPDESGAIHELMQGFAPGKPKSVSPQQQSLTPEHQQKLLGAYQPVDKDQDPLSEFPGNDALGVDLDYLEDDGPLHKKDGAYDPEKPTTFFNQPSHPPGWWNPLLWPYSTKPYHERMKQMDDEDAARSKHFNDYMDHVLEERHPESKDPFSYDHGGWERGVIDTDPEPAHSGEGPSGGYGDPTREEFWRHHSNLDSITAANAATLAALRGTK